MIGTSIWSVLDRSVYAEKCKNSDGLLKCKKRLTYSASIRYP